MRIPAGFERTRERGQEPGGEHEGDANEEQEQVNELGEDDAPPREEAGRETKDARGRGIEEGRVKVTGIRGGVRQRGRRCKSFPQTWVKKS